MQQHFQLPRQRKTPESDSDHFRRFRGREEEKQQKKKFENEDFPGGIETISR